MEVRRAAPGEWRVSRCCCLCRCFGGSRDPHSRSAGKLRRRLLHLADAAEGVATYLAQGFAALGDKLGPILWMLAARRQFDADDIAGFFKVLPHELDGIPLRHVIEPRHESFRDERFYDLCRKRGVAIVFGDDDEFPCIDADTASFRYARLQRMREDVPTGYDSKRLDEFAKLVSGWAEDGRDVFAFMINGAKERAPAAALALQERLR